MDAVTLIYVAAGVVGIIAGVVVVVQYLEQRRECRQTPTQQPVSAPAQPKPPIPNDLPPRSEFIGREQEKTQVREALASRYPLVCIDGIGGIEKTSLALEVAYQCLAASKGEVPIDGVPIFDGYIWTSAKDRELRLDDVLDAVARTLDYPGIAQQPSGEKQESVPKLLQSKRYLLIVDNLETVTDYRSPDQRHVQPACMQGAQALANDAHGGRTARLPRASWSNLMAGLIPAS